LPSASGGGGVQIDSPTQSGVPLLVAAGATVVLGEAVVLLLDDVFAELELEAVDRDAGCEPHAVTARQPIAMVPINGKMFDIHAQCHSRHGPIASLLQ
jgi:hypothetical protein